LRHAERGPRPTFRFLFGPTRGQVLTPAFVADRTVRTLGIVPGAPAAIGDIVALDDDRAEARFAYLAPGLRERAEDQLERWAEADDWRLEIRPGTAPLGHFGETSRTFRCTACGHTSYLSATAAMIWIQQPLHRTRCSECGDGRQLPLANWA
jgi:ribosomal protein L37E